LPAAYSTLPRQDERRSLYPYLPYLAITSYAFALHVEKSCRLLSIYAPHDGFCLRTASWQRCVKCVYHQYLTLRCCCGRPVFLPHLPASTLHSCCATVPLFITRLVLSLVLPLCATLGLLGSRGSLPRRQLLRFVGSRFCVLVRLYRFIYTLLGRWLPPGSPGGISLVPPVSDTRMTWFAAGDLVVGFNALADRV